MKVEFDIVGPVEAMGLEIESEGGPTGAGDEDNDRRPDLR